MATDARPSNRPRPFLLVLLGLAVVAYVATQMFSGRPVTPPVSTADPRAAAGQPAGKIDPAELDVHIEALQRSGGAPQGTERNPFRFQPKAPPPAPPVVAPPPRPRQPAPPPRDPGPTPIGTLVKFIGIIETGGARIGAFSDCRYTFSGREGEVIEGRFRVVRIGVESATLEYADGRGRTTLPLNGQACVVR